jgi:hypothetical protein
MRRAEHRRRVAGQAQRPQARAARAHPARSAARHHRKAAHPRKPTHHRVHKRKRRD